jgi:FdhE protein
MTVDLAFTSQQIKQAAAALRQQRPAYTGLLNFYERIFVAQDDSKGQINLDPIEISAETLALKRKEKFSLIGISEFVIDQKAATALLKQICQITETGNDEMADAARAIQNATAGGELNLQAVFAALLNMDDAYFEKIEKDMGIEKRALAFIAYNSIKPSLVHCTGQLASYISSDDPWEKGFCPVCGSAPGFSLFKDEGNRYLFCGFCWHQWTAQRIYCPFCENKDKKTLHYFFSEKEKNYRIDVCDSCQTYLKAIDQRSTDRIIYPPLEFVASLHLDLKAQEMGFKSGIQLELQ